MQWERPRGRAAAAGAPAAPGRKRTWLPAAVRSTSAPPSSIVGADTSEVPCSAGTELAPSPPRHTSVAMTHSSCSSDMTYTDWYFVSFEAEYTESGLFLSDASPPLSVGVPFSSPAEPWGWHLASCLPWGSAVAEVPLRPCSRL